MATTIKTQSEALGTVYVDAERIEKARRALATG